jgi:hypothetical protein
MVHRIERIVLFSLYVPFWGSVKRGMSEVAKFGCEILRVAQLEAVGVGGGRVAGQRGGRGGGENSYVIITESVVERL